MVFSPSSLSPRKPKYFYRRLSQSADIGSECNDQADRYGTTARSILKSRHLSMSSSWEMLHGGKDTNGRRFGAYHHAPIQFGKWGAECTGVERHFVTAENIAWNQGSSSYHKTRTNLSRSGIHESPFAMRTSRRIAPLLPYSTKTPNSFRQTNQFQSCYRVGKSL